MIIEVTPVGVALREHRVFGDLRVALTDGVDLAEALTVAGAGRPAGDDVLVSERWIRDAVAGLEDDDEEWLTGFEAMLGYARAHGWVEAGGDGIRAHVVPLDPATPAG